MGGGEKGNDLRERGETFPLEQTTALPLTELEMDGHVMMVMSS